MKRRLILALCACLSAAAPAAAQEVIPPPAPQTPPSPPPAAPAAPAVLVSPPGGEYADAGELWAGVDYLISWFRRTTLTPLVTTSPAGTERVLAGVLGEPGTTTLFGGDHVNDGARSGFRLRGGYWFGPERKFGATAGFTMIESQSSFFSAASDGSLILARPFVDVFTGEQQSVLVAYPGSSGGSIDVRASSGNFYEAHLDLTEKVIDGDLGTLSALLGYRFYRYDDALRIRQRIAPTDPNFVPGTLITTQDSFSTQNEFHGVDFGVRAQLFWENLSLDLLAKIAVGRLQREITIGGGQQVAVPGADPLTQPGGVYALSSNIGKHHRGDWTIFPEFGVTAAWQVSSNLKLRLGYSIMFLDNVARAADQIDFSLNPNLFPGADAGLGGPAAPAFNLMRTDVWIQSINLGVEFTY